MTSACSKMSSASLNNWRRPRSSIQRWRFRALDEQPERERQLRKECRLENSQLSISVLRCQKSGQAHSDPAAGGDKEPDAEKARQKTGPVHQNSQWEKPYASKQQRGSEFIVVQAEKQHD